MTGPKHTHTHNNISSSAWPHSPLHPLMQLLCTKTPLNGIYTSRFLSSSLAMNCTKNKSTHPFPSISLTSHFLSFPFISFHSERALRQDARKTSPFSPDFPSTTLPFPFIPSRAVRHDSRKSALLYSSPRFPQDYFRRLQLILKTHYAYLSPHSFLQVARTRPKQSPFLPSSPDSSKTILSPFQSLIGLLQASPSLLLLLSDGLQERKRRSIIKLNYLSPSQAW